MRPTTKWVMMMAMQLELPPFYYDYHGYYPYVMLNGDAATRQKVVEELQDAGLSCSRVGRSRRPASNGIKYDWFIRVFDPSTRQKPDKAKVEKILYRFFGIEPVEEQVKRYQQEVEASKQRLLALQERLRSLEQEIEHEREEQNFILSEALQREDRVKQLEEENANLKEQLKSWEEIVSVQEQQIKHLKKQLASLEASLTSRDKRGRGAARLLGDLFPNMRFVKGSMDYLLVEAPDSKNLLRILNNLYNGKSVKKERFESLKRRIWFKVIYKGFSRIYFTRKDNVIHVFLSPKNLQERSTKKLLDEYTKSELAY